MESSKVCTHQLVLDSEEGTKVEPEIIRLCSGTSITVGRSRQKCSVILGSSRGPLMISRVHATLEPVASENGQPERWRLVDHSSRNGSFVNNMKVSEVLLKHGDRITFGGGGLLPYGSTKHHIDSEYTYRFLKCDKLSSAPSLSSTEEDMTLEWRRLSGRLERKDTEDEIRPSRKRSLKFDNKKAPSNKKQRVGLKALNPNIHHDDHHDKNTKQEKSPCSISSSSSSSSSLTASSKKRKADEDMRVKMNKELLHKEFICPVCLDYFLQTKTLACGHSFCSPCIGKCLENKIQCPICRDTVSKKPVRSCALDGAIRALLQQETSKSDQEAHSRYKKRQKQWKSDQRKGRRTAAKLRNVIQEAKDEGKNFLDIRHKWNAEEREIFRKGVVMYRGPARIEYCKTTGLTPEFIDSKMYRELIEIAINVGVISEDGYDMETECTSLSSLRSRLHMFILYG